MPRYAIFVCSLCLIVSAAKADDAPAQPDQSQVNAAYARLRAKQAAATQPATISVADLNGLRAELAQLKVDNAALKAEVAKLTAGGSAPSNAGAPGPGVKGPDATGRPEPPVSLTPGPPATQPGEKGPRFDIKGQRIGDIINKEWAYRHCPGSQLEEHLGYVDSPGGESLVDNGKQTDGDITGSDEIEINDKTVIVLYEFHDRRLVGVELSFDAELFDAVKKTYTDKFGEPPSVDHQKLTTKGGDTYMNEIDTWHTDSGPFILQKYGKDVDDGIAYLLTPQMDKATADRKAEEAQSLKGKL